MDMKPTVPELSDNAALENPSYILEATPDIPSLDNVIPSLETPVENCPPAEIKQGLENIGELTSMDQDPELLGLYSDQQSEIKHSTQPLSDSTSPV